MASAGGSGPAGLLAEVHVGDVVEVALRGGARARGTVAGVDRRIGSLALRILPPPDPAPRPCNAHPHCTRCRPRRRARTGSSLAFAPRYPPLAVPQASLARRATPASTFASSGSHIWRRRPGCARADTGAAPQRPSELRLTLPRVEPAQVIERADSRVEPPQAPDAAALADRADAAAAKAAKAMEHMDSEVSARGRALFEVISSTYAPGLCPPVGPAPRAAHRRPRPPGLTAGGKGTCWSWATCASPRPTTRTPAPVGRSTSAPTPARWCAASARTPPRRPSPPPTLQIRGQMERLARRDATGLAPSFS